MLGLMVLEKIFGDFKQGVPGSNPGRCTFRCGLEQVTLTLLSTGLTQEAVDGRPTWTNCDEAGDYVVPNVLSPRDLLFRPDNMDKTVPHTQHILAWRPSWSCDLDHSNKLSFPAPKEAPYENCH